MVRIYLLVFNTELQPEKWYTQAIVVSPFAAQDKRVRELFRLEVQGKGIRQPPRIGVLAGGLAVGNTDGFGFCAPQAAEPEGNVPNGS